MAHAFTVSLSPAEWRSKGEMSKQVGKQVSQLAVLRPASDLFSGLSFACRSGALCLAVERCRSLGKNVIAWNAAGTFGPKEMARAASKFAGLEDLLQACQLEWSSLAPSADRSDARLHFEAARYALPVEPNFPDHPSFDPAPYLDTANRRVYGTLGP